jgi:hypothetical protein
MKGVKKYHHLPLKFLSEEKEQVNSKRNLDLKRKNLKNIKGREDNFSYLCHYGKKQDDISSTFQST